MKGSWQIAQLLCGLVLVAILSSCSSSNPKQTVPPPKTIVPKFLYVANYGSSSLSAFTVNANTGTLVPISGSPFATGSGPFSLVLDPSAKFLYVVNHGAFEISAYNITASGSLTEIAGSPFATAPNPNGAVLSASGKFLYVPMAEAMAGNANIGQIWKYAIDSTAGSLNTASAIAFPAGSLPT